MKLTVLGSGNAFNQEVRLNSSYFVESQKGNILLDCGFTVPYALQKQGIEFSSIDYLFITHYHGDHYAGLSALLLGLKYISQREKPITIIGPEDVKAKTIELLKILYGGTEKVVDEIPIAFLSVSKDGGNYEIDEISFEVHKMVHADQSLPVGYVFNLEGIKLGFSGDTCWHNGVEPFINACDKVILESNFVERVGEGHISIEELEASEVVKNKKAEIYLTHLHAGSAQKGRELGYNILEDSDVLEF